VTAADTVDFVRVNVLYQPYRPSGVRLAPKPADKPNALDGQPVTVTANPPVLLPALPDLKARAPAVAARLTIEGVTDPGDTAARIRVFVNKPDATPKTPLTDEHYAGTVFIVPMRRKEGGHDMPAHAPPARSLGVDLPARVAAAIGNEPPKVTLVAVDND